MGIKQYERGHVVVYGTNGLCIIEEIRPMKLAAGMKEEDYCVLSLMRDSETKIFIPMKNEKLLGKLREVKSKTQIDQLLMSAKDKDTLRWDNDRRNRTESFHEILMEGVSEDLVRMIGCIYEKKRSLIAQGRKLSVTDGNTLKSAEALVEEEFAYALDIPPHQVSDYIRDLMEVPKEN